MDIDTNKFGYISKEVSDLVDMVKEGKEFLETYCEKYLEDGGVKLNLVAHLCETKTYFNLELKKQFPRLGDNKSSYERFTNYVYITAGYIELVDDQIKKLQCN